MVIPANRGRGPLIALGVIVIILVASNLLVYNYMQAQISTLIADQSNLKDIVDLKKATILVNNQVISQPSNSYTYWTFNISYAGYVWVSVTSSNNTYIYAKMKYTTRANYDEQIWIGPNGTGSRTFPVLPPQITVGVGNTDIFHGATETVTITYYY